MPRFSLGVVSHSSARLHSSWSRVRARVRVRVRVSLSAPGWPCRRTVGIQELGVVHCLHNIRKVLKILKTLGSGVGDTVEGIQLKLMIGDEIGRKLATGDRIGVGDRVRV